MVEEVFVEARASAPGLAEVSGQLVPPNPMVLAAARRRDQPKNPCQFHGVGDALVLGGPPNMTLRLPTSLRSARREMIPSCSRRQVENIEVRAASACDGHDMNNSRADGPYETEHRGRSSLGVW